MKLQKILFVPDTHRPYHDKKAWALFLKAAKAYKPDILVVGGDFGDFYCTNAHRKDPNKNRYLEHELADINVGLDELDALGAKRKIFIEGNHEENLERYLKDRAPELFNVMKITELLRLKQRKWEFYPYRRKKAYVGKLAITHDLGNSGSTAVSKALGDFQGNIVINHIHRINFLVGGNYKGKRHVAASFGWLGDFNHIDYMDQDKAKKDWAHGFGVGYLAPNGHVHLTPVVMVDYTCVVEGKLYRV